MHRLPLGHLETEILGVVRDRGEVTIRDVLRVMYERREIAYTTVSTTLLRLHKKGLLERKTVHSRGKQVYVFNMQKAKSRRKYVEDAVDRLVQAFGPNVVSAAVHDAGLEEE